MLPAVGCALGHGGVMAQPVAQPKFKVHLGMSRQISVRVVRCQAVAIQSWHGPALLCQHPLELLCQQTSELAAGRWGMSSMPCSLAVSLKQYALPRAPTQGKQQCCNQSYAQHA